MSVTKIILRHNRTGAGTLPQAEAARCCEPLWFKNKLYIRSQNAEELVNPEDYPGDEAAYADAVEEFRQTHQYQDGDPIFIGPYEHPARTTGSQLAVNVSENTQSSTEDYIYSSHIGQYETDMSRTYRAITGIVTDKEGHIITAEAGLSIFVRSRMQFMRFCNGEQSYTPITISTSGHGSLTYAPNVSTEFTLPAGVGHLETTGKLLTFDEATAAGTTTKQNGYTWSIGNGDCLAITDADWSSHTAMGTGIDDEPSFNHQLVRSPLAFNISETNKYLCQNGTWKTPSGLNVAAASGDTSVKGVIAGEVSIDGVPTEFTVQPANSYLGGKSGSYYYTGQGVVRPLGTTTGLQTENKRKLLYTSEDTTILNKLCPTILRQPASVAPGTETEPQKAKWVAIPVFVDYHKVDGTDRVEAVPYIMLPENLLRGVLEYWQERTQSSSETEGTEPVGENIIADDSNYSE